MSKIIVYSKEGFEGGSAEFNNDVHDLREKGFNDAIASIKVIGKPWVAYYDKDFAGKQRVFEQGEYATRDDKGQFSSLKMVSNDTNLHSIGFGDKDSSHKVRSGVWVLYEHINRQGSQLISYPGDQIPNYVLLSFNDVASHVRPLLPRP